MLVAPTGRLGIAASIVLWFTVLVGRIALAEPTTGIFGVVEDQTGRGLPAVDVVIQNELTGARWKTISDHDGHFVVSPLTPGQYKITVRTPGFRTVSRVGAVFDSGEGLRVDFAMELLELHEAITVRSTTNDVDPAAGSTLVMTRDTPGATLPSNGGDYRVLFDLLPGIVTTPASTNDAGQFTSNGQRPNSNVFRVDGMSANTGVGSSVLPGAFPGASLPAMTAIGSTESLVSTEAAQSLELHTSEFSPEYTDRPGAVSAVNTRSGGNQFHQEVFGRIRESGWSASDWFADSRGSELPRPSYERFGVSLGGPIRKNRTFYFVSAETSDLNYRAPELIAVPSFEARQTAPENLRQLLSYFSPPTGPGLGGGEAEALITEYDKAHMWNTNLRIDQSIGSTGTLFLRATKSPSTNLGDQSELNWTSITGGILWGSAKGTMNDIRVNYSRAALSLSSFGGTPGFPSDPNIIFGLAGLLPGFSITPDGGVVFAPPAAGLTSALPQVAGGETILGLSVPGLGQFISSGAGQARQDQWEVRETYSRTKGRHSLRAGIDFIRLHPSRNIGSYVVLGSTASLDSLLDGKPLAVTSFTVPQKSSPVYILPLFAQDNIRIGENANVFFGIAWTVTPPTTGNQTPSVSGLWTGTNWQGDYVAGDVNQTARWPMRFGQIAPRFGLAYRLAHSSLVLRAGVGKFYDAALGAAVNPINGAPFNSWLLGANGLGSATGINVPQGGETEDVRRFLSGNYPSLQLPASYQWRVAIESTFGGRGVGSLAYLGSASKNLLGQDAYVDPSSGLLERLVAVTDNSSSYQALQMRYSGFVMSHLYGSVSYTWGHSIDTASQDSSVFLIHSGYHLDEARANSSFDVRHQVTAALSYRIPLHVEGFRLPTWLANWSASTTFRARTGFPIDVLSSELPLGEQFSNVGRPDRVPGVPVWISDPTVAGQRRLNPAAFVSVLNGDQGNLGRNAISGFGLSQVDVSFKRQFPVIMNISAEIGVNIFNLLNHPAFADPVPFLSSPWFGQSTSMQNLMLGSGSPNTGLSPLFLTGGPRSVELSFRISF